MQNYKLKLKNYLKSIPLSAGYQSFSFFIFHFSFLIFFYRKKLGFTLLETVVALGIILSALVGPVSLITSGLSDFASAKHKIIAANLAQEGIELARAIREANVICDALNGPPVWPWNEDPDPPDPPGGRTFADTGNIGLAAKNAVTVVCGEGELSVPRMSQSCANKLALDANGFYGDAGIETIFARCVRMITSQDSSDRDSDGIQDNEEMDITSTVTWNERGTEKTLTLRERLYNWR